MLYNRLESWFNSKHDLNGADFHPACQGLISIHPLDPELLSRLRVDEAVRHSKW
jgi:hypothetical protein